ncbi:MAG: FAD/NAD(P)-binding protein, partial [Corynebacterium variabile]|uniref:FAD/NAD(P)-binding protein n=1 Tax=Corynebacterium variabile TaxID=1727 RepID=UPI003F9C0AFE
MSRALVIVGAGPRTTGILLALAALPEVPATEIHVIDPYPAGPGRIWRAVQPTEVWMNNTSDEITVYADGDPAVPAAVPGPGLAKWAGERHFVPRRDAAAYLRDAFDRAVAVLTDPATHPGITVTEHRTRAEHVTPPDG